MRMPKTAACPQITPNKLQMKVRRARLFSRVITTARVSELLTQAGGGRRPKPLSTTHSILYNPALLLQPEAKAVTCARHEPPATLCMTHAPFSIPSNQRPPAYVFLTG